MSRLCIAQTSAYLPVSIKTVNNVLRAASELDHRRVMKTHPCNVRLARYCVFPELVTATDVSARGWSEGKVRGSNGTKMDATSRAHNKQKTINGRA